MVDGYPINVPFSNLLKKFKSNDLIGGVKLSDWNSLVRVLRQDRNDIIHFARPPQSLLLAAFRDCKELLSESDTDALKLLLTLNR